MKHLQVESISDDELLHRLSEMMCRTHNGYSAEHHYGKDFMARYRRSPRRVSEPASVYTINIRAVRALSRNVLFSVIE